MNNLLTGAVFGAALTASGVYLPSVILSQFSFSDFRMLQTFLTAVAGSTLLLTATQSPSLHLTSLPPRKPSPLGLGLLLPGLHHYDGNVLGGALLGAGMALSGACPGTVLAQLGAGGVRSGWYAFGGAVLAGVVWSWMVERRRQGQGQGRAGGDDDGEKGTTVDEALGAGSRAVVVAALEVVYVGVVAVAAGFAKGGSGDGVVVVVHPVVGGLLIAAAQAVSLVLRGALLGTSTSYEELGAVFWGSLKGQRPAKYGNILFAAGMVGGAWALSSAVPSLAPVVEAAVSPAVAALGGFLILLGSRMAGGCTSGHGISGLSLLSTSSFVTVAATFTAGGLTGLLLR
ncbi:hypothetical protein VTK56DRAFT_7649 [Thermocarpiscus australiensis]